MSKLRFDVIQDAFKKKAVTVETPSERPSEYYGSMVFNKDKMRKYLDNNTYRNLLTV